MKFSSIPSARNASGQIVRTKFRNILTSKIIILLITINFLSAKSSMDAVSLSDNIFNFIENETFSGEMLDVF
jgi:hypothetical protein